MRLGRPSTLKRWAFSSKTHRFENAVENGYKRKRIQVSTIVWTVENASKWKRWRHPHHLSGTQASHPLEIKHHPIMPSPMLLANFVASGLELNLALFNLILVYRRRISVVRALALSRFSYHSAGAGTPYRRTTSFFLMRAKARLFTVFKFALAGNAENIAVDHCSLYLEHAHNV